MCVIVLNNNDSISGPHLTVPSKPCLNFYKYGFIVLFLQFAYVIESRENSSHVGTISLSIDFRQP